MLPSRVLFPLFCVCVYFWTQWRWKKKLWKKFVVNMLLWFCLFVLFSLAPATFLVLFLLCFLFAFSFIFFSVVGFDSLTFVQCVFHFVCLEFYTPFLLTWIGSMNCGWKKDMKMSAQSHTAHSIQPEKFHLNWMTIFLWFSALLLFYFIRGRSHWKCILRGNLAEIEWFIWIELIHTLHNTARLLI